MIIRYISSRARVIISLENSPFKNHFSKKNTQKFWSLKKLFYYAVCQKGSKQPEKITKKNKKKLLLTKKKKQFKKKEPQRET